MINDGKAAASNNDLRWVSDANPPHRVELAWEQPQTIGAVRIVTGWNQGKRFVGMLEDFSLQYQDGQQWKDIPGAKATGNRRVDWSARFKPVRTQKIRLTVTAALGGLARIWEIEVYNPPASAK